LIYHRRHLHKGSSLVKDDAAAKQAKAKAKQIARIGVLGTDGKRYKLSYDGPQQEAEAVEEDSVIRFHFPEPPKVYGGGVASLQLKDVHFTYADRAGVPGESIFRGAHVFVGVCVCVCTCCSRPTRSFGKIKTSSISIPCRAA
jgi:hypothetical protein